MNIIVSFKKAQNAEKIRAILVKSGYGVAALCTTGAQTLSAAHELDTGLLICGERFPDMMYAEIYADLPEGFGMLLVASPEVCAEREIREIVCLSMPLQVHELMETVEMMSYEVDKRRRSRREKPRERTEEERNTIEQAKLLLMSRNRMSEEEAHHYLQKTSMDNATSLAETAQMILSLM